MGKASRTRQTPVSRPLDDAKQEMPPRTRRLPPISEWPEPVQTVFLLLTAPFCFVIALAVVTFSMLMGFAFLGWMAETVDHTIPKWWKKRKADE